MYVIAIYKKGEFAGYDSDRDRLSKNIKFAFKHHSLSEAKRWRTLLKRELPKQVFNIHKCALVDLGVV